MSIPHAQQFSFTITARSRECLARTGVLCTSHGEVKTPAFVVVGTNATVKTLTPEELRDIGAQIVLANTYHLYLEPTPERIRAAGGLAAYMHWDGPTMTDSGGFQVFSLGAAYGKSLSKIWRGEDEASVDSGPTHGGRIVQEDEVPQPLARITDDGVEFTSHRDGSRHFFTPEKSIEIQHAIGADIIFAFDECTSPRASYEYQKTAMDRTHRWAERSLKAHRRLSSGTQWLFGIVQGGQFEDLRKESARVIGSMEFDGFGLGGSYRKEEIDIAIAWITELLPERKPRHLLGIGEPEDIFAAVQQGIDLFDCVMPTRIARNGQLYTKYGKINILNARFRDDLTPIETGCACYTCTHYTRAYLSHLFRVREILGLRLATIHNVYFITRLVEEIRSHIQSNTFLDYKQEFLSRFYGTRVEGA